MSETRKIRHLLMLLEGYDSKPVASKEYTDTGEKYRLPSPNISPGSSKDTNFDGWSVAGKTEQSKKDATQFQKSLQGMAKDYGVDSSRAFTANLNPTISTVDKFSRNPDGHGLQQSMYAPGNPYHSDIKIKRDLTGHNSDEVLAHELAHHNSMNFSAVDADGNMRIINDPDNSVLGITGFGANEQSADKYLELYDKHSYDDLEEVDQESLRDDLYKRVMDNPTNKQRPELKHALATAVSHILSDSNVLDLVPYTTEWSKQEKNYALAPEEMWARAMSEFTRLKRLPADERFDEMDGIAPETYKKIQELMDTIEVKYGHTMTKKGYNSRDRGIA